MLTDTLNSALRQNVIALSVLQICNYLVPLITFPYLARVLGPQGYGKVVFVQTLMQYFLMIIDYGFPWSATRAIAASRYNHAQVSAIFSATWACQWLLALPVVLTALAATTVIPLPQQDMQLYLAGLSIVLGNLLFPAWLFYGLEKMKELALFQVPVRALMILPLFFFVSGPKDAWAAVLITGSSSILSGVASLYWIRKQKLATWSRPKASCILRSLQSGSVLFLSRLSISFYTAFTPLLLGVLSGTTEVAYFGVADKIRNFAQSVLTPISQALFPTMSHLYASNGPAARRLLKFSLVSTVLVSGCISAALWFFSDWVVLLVAGTDYVQVGAVLRWMSFLPTIIGLSNVFGVQVMLPNLLNRPFNRTLAAAALLSAILSVPLLLWKQAEGAAITLLITELTVTCTMGLYLWRTGHLRSLQNWSLP